MLDGMGVAGGDDVQPDPDATIDGAEPSPRIARSSFVRSATDSASDYKELVSVDRHHYVISGEIATGGMGRVLAARDLRLGRRVAIKELLPRNRDAARRFEREARITARLQHPAIIHVYEAGVWRGGEPFYAMTMVAGRSLDKVVVERPTLNERLALLPNVIAVADALAYAHSEHVIHRDLKPANVLVGDFGETVVIDWGLAKDLRAQVDASVKPGESLQLRASDEETVSGSVVGTPAYMPPEQARGEPLDQRADVYSLGALLYKVLAGEAPYVGVSSDAVLELVKSRPPTPLEECEPGAPPELVAIIAKAMARDPGDRYATARELAQDLKRFETGQLVAAHRYTTRQLIWRWLERYRVAVAIAAIASVVLALGATLSVQRILAEKERAETEQRKASLGRIALLEERGRSELLAGHAGAALAYLVGAAHDDVLGGARGFLIADAMAPFEAERKQLLSGMRSVAIAVSPDGKHVATAGSGWVELWSTSGMAKAERRLGPVDHQIGVLAFDASSSRIAAGGSDGSVQIWGLDGTVVAKLSGHRGPILDLAFASHGRALVTASSDATARVWDIATGASLVSTCHTGPVVSARFSPEDDRVATASEDATACIWDARRGDAIMALRGFSRAVNSARWSPDGDWLLTASDDGTARVWSTRASLEDGGGKAVVTMRHDRGTIRIAELSLDGRSVLTAGSDSVARIWSLPKLTLAPGTARVIATLAGHSDTIVQATFGEDDTLVATASADRVAKVWDRISGQVISSYEHGDVVTGIAFAAGDHLITGSRDGTARVWDRRVLKERRDLDSVIHAVAVSRDGTIATGTDDSKVTLFGGGSARILRGHHGRVLAVAFTPDGTQLVTAGDDARPIVWAVASGTALRTLGEHPARIESLAISPDGGVVACGSTDAVRLWTLAGQAIGTLEQRGARLTAITFDPSGTFVVGGTDDGSLVIWDRRSKQPGVVVDRRAGMAGTVTALAFSPNGSLVVGGRAEVRIYRFVAGRLDPRPAVTLEGPTGEVTGVVVSGDASRIITAGADGIARVWDAAKGKLLGTREAHGRAITALALEGDTLWIAAEDGTLGGWDVHSERRPVAELERFLVDKHVPERLDNDDVVRIKEGSADGQRRSDRE